MIYMTRCKIKHNLYWNKDFHQMDINVSTLVSYNLIFIVAISIDISEHFLLWKQIKKEARNDQASKALIKRRYHRVLAHVQFDTTQRTLSIYQISPHISCKTDAINLLNAPGLGFMARLKLYD